METTEPKYTVREFLGLLESFKLQLVHVGDSWGVHTDVSNVPPTMPEDRFDILAIPRDPSSENRYQFTDKDRKRGRRVRRKRAVLARVGKAEADYSTAGAAQELGVKHGTLLWRIRAGKVKAYHLPNSRQWRIPSAEVQRLAALKGGAR